MALPSPGSPRRDPRRCRRGRSRDDRTDRGGFRGRRRQDIRARGDRREPRTYEEQRTRTDRVVRALVDDAESRDAYLAYALEGRAALWLRVPDETQVPKALRALADVRCLHARHYGRSDVTDYRIAAE